LVVAGGVEGKGGRDALSASDGGDREGVPGGARGSDGAALCAGAGAAGLCDVGAGLSLLWGFEGCEPVQAGLRQRDDEGDLESHALCGSAAIARYGGWAADRGDRAFAGRAQRAVRV